LEKSLNINQIKDCIPHRYPFLLVDRVIEWSKEEGIVAVKAVSNTEPILQGHFPDDPIFPGVLVIEGLAQTAAIYGRLLFEDKFSTCYLTEVSNARFRKPVRPGDLLRYEIKLTKSRAPFYWFEGQAVVNGEVVASGTLSALLK